MKQRLENQGNRPAWEEMTTQELDDLLWRDFAADQEGFLDPADILAITEVINSREEDTPTDADVQAAWETFRARIREEENTPTEGIPEETPAAPGAVPFAKPERKKPGRKKLRWVIIAAAVVCLLAVPAMGSGAMENLVQWTTQHFSFLPQNSLPQERPGAVTYEEVQETVAQLTELPVLPTWYPEGTMLEKMEINDLLNGTSVDVLFSLGEDVFSLSISVYDTKQEGTAQYEKNEGYVEPYYVNHVPHYIMENMGRRTVAWQNGNTENAIQGDLTVEELKQIIDSIYS